MSLFVEARAQQQIRLRGGGAEEAEPETPGSTASGPASGPASAPASASAKKQKQMGLQYFFSSPEEKKAKPVRSLALSPYKRRRLSRWQQDALAERDEALRQLAEAEAKQAASEEELASAAAKLRKKGGRPQKQGEQPQRASNRKSAGSKALRLELSAKKKAQYCKEMQESLSEFASKADFWKAQVAKYGMSKQSLKDMLSKAQAWEGLAKRPLAAARKREPPKRVRICPDCKRQLIKHAGCQVVLHKCTICFVMVAVASVRQGHSVACRLATCCNQRLPCSKNLGYFIENSFFLQPVGRQPTRVEPYTYLKLQDFN